MNAYDCIVYIEPRQHISGLLIWSAAHPVKIDLNKKLDPKQKIIQSFNIDAKGLRKTRNENPLTWEIGVTS